MVHHLVWFRFSLPTFPCRTCQGAITTGDGTTPVGPGRPPLPEVSIGPLRQPKPTQSPGKGHRISPMVCGTPLQRQTDSKRCQEKSIARQARNSHVCLNQLFLELISSIPNTSAARESMAHGDGMFYSVTPVGHQVLLLPLNRRVKASTMDTTGVVPPLPSKHVDQSLPNPFGVSLRISRSCSLSAPMAHPRTKVRSRSSPPRPRHLRPTFRPEYKAGSPSLPSAR